MTASQEKEARAALLRLFNATRRGADNTRDYNVIEAYLDGEGERADALVNDAESVAYRRGARAMI